MKKNYIKYPLYLTSIVVGILLLLNFIPDGITRNLNIRKIDILSDIRADTLVHQVNDLQLLLPPPPPPKKDIPCPPGMICFEDFSEEKEGLNRFFKALESTKNGKTARIAFFGDSYIEGDIFSADLRYNLQNKYGGNGVGLMPATSQVAGFRQTVKHNYGGWKSYSIIDGKHYANMGISGNYFVPDGNSWVKYSGVKKSHLETVKEASIVYYLPDGKATIHYKINGSKETKTADLPASPKVSQFFIKDSISSIEIKFASTSNLYVYGISLQDSTGIVVDNFSLRGTPGTTLKYLPENVLTQIDELLGYDLIILQYGLNVMSANRTNYLSYQKAMGETVLHLKKCFPNSDILLLSVGDRSTRGQGDYVTMPGVPALVAHQQTICAETGIVFWNLFEAMGGSGSMVEMVKAKPPRANKDYTHLNFEGGKYLGEILFKTIEFEKERYDKLKNNRKYNKNNKQT